MSSRSILIAAGFSLGCTILLGSALLQLAVGNVRASDMDSAEAAASAPPAAAVEDERSKPDDNPGVAAARHLEELLEEAEALIHGRYPSAGETNGRTLDGDAYAAYPPSSDGIDAAEPSDPYSTEPVPLPEEAILLFAEMVQIIDEAGSHRFVIQIGDPDLRSARRRAEILRSSLLLALRNPSRLVIEEAPSSRPQVSVRTLDTLSMP